MASNDFQSNKRPSVSQYAIIITDGEPEDKDQVNLAVNTLKGMAVQRYAIAVGSNVSISILRNITGVNS
jgi:hypothetical protein